MNDLNEEQIIKHISQLKGWTILEILEHKPGVKKIFATKNNTLGIFYTKDEGIVSKEKNE